MSKAALKLAIPQLAARASAGATSLRIQPRVSLSDSPRKTARYEGNRPWDSPEWPRERLVFVQTVNQIAPGKVADLHRRLQPHLKQLERSVRGVSLEVFATAGAFPRAKKVNAIITEWLETNGIDTNWLRWIVVVSAGLWARNEVTGRGGAPSLAQVFPLGQVFPDDHPFARPPSGLDWVLENGRSFSRETMGAGGVPWSSGRRAAGWNPFQETEEQFRARVEAYIASVKAGARKYGLKQRTVMPGTLRLEHFEWLVRRRLLGVKLKDLARGNLNSANVRDACNQLARWLDLPARRN